MTMRFRAISRAASAAALLVLMGTVCLVAVRSAAVDTGFKEPLELSDADLSTLAQGKPIAKTLTSTSPREMITAGGVRIRGSAMTRFVNQFKTLEGFRTSQFVLQIEKFGETPQLSDLEKLTLDPEDLESLRACRVGECDVQLSADDIQRFTQVNWTSANAARDATTL